MLCRYKKCPSRRFDVHSLFTNLTTTTFYLMKCTIYNKYENTRQRKRPNILCVGQWLQLMSTGKDLFLHFYESSHHLLIWLDHLNLEYSSKLKLKCFLRSLRNDHPNSCIQNCQQTILFPSAPEVITDYIIVFPRKCGSVQLSWEHEIICR